MGTPEPAYETQRPRIQAAQAIARETMAGVAEPHARRAPARRGDPKPATAATGTTASADPKAASAGTGPKAADDPKAASAGTGPKVVDDPKAANAVAGLKAADDPKAANAAGGPGPKMMKAK